MSEKSVSTALVIDDNEYWLRMLTRLVSGAGYTVSTARIYEEGLRIAESSLPDLIVTDIRLRDEDESNVDGLRLLEKLYEQKQLNASIVVTGYSTPEKKSYAEELGAVYLEKGSFDRKDFQLALERAKSTLSIASRQDKQVGESQESSTTIGFLKELFQNSRPWKADLVACV